ncbi:tail fiber domain-containing protein [Salmonella enterica subsp. enterica serovar Berkeley]|nr:tail fiber domain-containing protein [Salmonella enterica subsp. enterica serovar Berkeley]
MTRTANYLDNPEVSGKENYLDYFGAYRVNSMTDDWNEYDSLILNVPHAVGKAHARGFSFAYGSAGSIVRTYGFDADGNKRFSYRMYHEGDKPTPAELNVYSKPEIDNMFRKSVYMPVPQGEHTSAYFKIATVTIPQGGNTVKIRITGGNGYNVGQTVQLNVVEIVARGGNGNPNGLNLAAYIYDASAVSGLFAIRNGSTDTYDIYYRYGRYTDDVIVEYGYTRKCAVTIHSEPSVIFEKPEPSDTLFDGKIITIFNTANKKGTLDFSGNDQGEYDVVSLNTKTGNNKKYLRKFRSKDTEMIWHETIQGNVYRLASGNTDTTEVFRIVGNSSVGGTYKGEIYGGRMQLDGGSNALTLRRPANQSNHITFQDARTGTVARQGWIGHGNDTTNDFTMYSDNGTNQIVLQQTGNILLSTGAKGGTREVQIEGGLNMWNQIRLRPSSSFAGAAASTMYIQTFGNSAERETVFEVKEDKGWHFYTQRNKDTQKVEMQVNGDHVIRANGSVLGNYTVNGSLISYGAVAIGKITNSLGGASIVLGDNDTGFKQNGDGILDVYANSAHIARYQPSAVTINKPLTVSGDITSSAWMYAGRFAINSTHGSWISMRNQNVMFGRNAVGNGSAGAIIRQDHADRKFFLAGLGNSQFGFYMINNSRADSSNGTDAAASLDANGDWYVSRNGSFNDVYIRSDRRLKVNLEELEDGALDKVKKLTAYRYDKVKSLSERDVIGREVGIIAQDLQEVLPEAVTTSDVGNGQDGKEEILTVSNSAVNALLVKAIQEMSAQMEEMRKEIAELKAK